MGTLRTIIGVWFQFWGGVLMIVGVVLLVFGGTALSIPTFDILSSLPLGSVVPAPEFVEILGTDPETGRVGCISGYIFNPDVNLCQRIGSMFEMIEPIPTSSGIFTSLSSIAGFGGLIYLGFGIFEFLIGTVIRGK